MKKLIAISFLVVLCFSHLGKYLVYQVQQHEAKEAMEELILANIPETTFEVFELEKYGSKIEWENEGHEFFLEGEMYDIAKIKKINGSTFLYCLNDKKEKRLLNDFAKSVRNDCNSGSPGKQSFKFQLSDFTISGIITLAPSVLPVNKQKSSFYAATVSQVKEITAPPPKDFLHC